MDARRVGSIALKALFVVALVALIVAVCTSERFRGGSGTTAAAATAETETAETEIAEAETEAEEPEDEEPEAEEPEAEEPEAEAKTEEETFAENWATIEAAEAGGEAGDAASAAELDEGASAASGAGLSPALTAAFGAEPWRPIEASVVIAAPVERVWRYVGDSANAREWSVYFDHITSLPGPADGQVGALRRCFRRADESGKRWDERVTEVVALRRRAIHVFALTGFRPRSANAHEYDVWQVYEPLEGGGTRLTFGSAPSSTSRSARVQWLASRGRAKRTFARNLENIRAALER
jgi:hypothetical protein